MKRYEGIHFYINIKNDNSIILDEEKRYGSVNRSIHALDTFFSSVESYGERNYKETFITEKITGSRLHLYVVDDIVSAFKTVKAVSGFAYKLSNVINKEIGKYKNLIDFSIQVGAAFGEFYDFEFSGEDGFAEMTTIGYAANFAAKIQGLTAAGRIGISENIYEELENADQNLFRRVKEKSIDKYGQDCYYSALLAQLSTSPEITPADMEMVKGRANEVDLYEIHYEGVRKQLDFGKLSRKDCKKLEGIPVYADVRGFTKQFDPEDENLDEMARRTQGVLSAMYNVTTQCGGIHVQFQGDRELSLYHDVPGDEGNSCFKPAVLAALRMIDAVKPLSLHIGVGADYGRLFATRIGARGDKDNILLGETVIRADYMEDKCAKEDQIAITKEVFDGLVSVDSSLAALFKASGDDIYIATIGFKRYLENKESERLQAETKKNSYNAAWG